MLDLKIYIDSLFEFLHESKKLPFSASAGGQTLSEVDKFFLSNYDLYGKKNGLIYKQVVGSFMQILQLLIPSENLARIFKYSIYFESMEHIIKAETSDKKNKPNKHKLYRDHILHPANVCWVGENLIFNLEEPFYNHLKASLESILPDRPKSLLIKEDDWVRFIKLTWCITSLTHDLGYLIELFEEKFSGNDLYLTGKNYLIFNKLSNYFENRLPGNIDLFKKHLEAIDDKLVNFPFLHSTKIHPIIASLELLHFLDNNREKLTGDREIYSYCYQLAALAIFEHHKRKHVQFKLNPFGYILVLADIIHEWDRYINIGITKSIRKSGRPKPNFFSPIKGGSIIKERQNLYKIQYQFARKPKEIREEKKYEKKSFLKMKQRELQDFLEFDGNLPQLKF
jgi:hypothetical protein